MFPIFQAALAFLFAATLALPGDAILQTGGGYLVSCFWLMLLAAWLLFRNANIPSRNRSRTPDSRQDRQFPKSSRNGKQKRNPIPGHATKRDSTGKQPDVPATPDVLLRWGLPDVLFLLFLLFYLLASPLVRQTHNGFVAINIAVAWVTAATAWFLFRQLIRTPRSVAAFALIVIAVSLSESFLSIYQEYVANPRLVAAYRNAPESMLQSEGFALDPDSAQRRLLESRLMSATPLGTYLLSNTLAGQLLPGCLLACSFAIGCFSSRNRAASVYVAIIAALILFALVLTRCRGAAVALFLVAMITPVALFTLSSKLRTKTSVAAILLIAALGGAAMFTVFSSKSIGAGALAAAKRSLAFRMEYWGATAEMIADHPLFGVGIGDFQTAYTRYKYESASEEILDPHNFLMEIFALGGVPSGLLFLAFLISVPLSSFKSKPTDETLDQPEHSQKDDVSAEAGNPTVLAWAALFGALFVVPATLPDRSPVPWEFLFAAPFAFVLVVPLTRTLRIADGIRTNIRSIPVGIIATISALLIHLLAAGGISYVNTLTLFAFLLASCLALRGTGRTERHFAPRTDKILSRSIAVFVLILFFALYYAIYLPTTGAWLAVETTRQGAATPFQQRVQKLEAQRSRLFFVPFEFQRELLEAKFLAWSYRHDERALHDLREELLRTESLATESSSMLLQLINIYEATDPALRDGTIRDKVLELADRAVRNYPNSARARFTYARLLWTTGDREAAIRQGCEALRLDAVTPHLDRKLPDAQRKLLEEMRPADGAP